MIVQFHIEEPSAALRAKKQSLMDAIEETVGILSQQLYETVQGKLSGGVLNVGTGALLGSVMLTAVQTTGVEFASFVEIPLESEQWLIGMVHEYGGNDWYEILPVNAQALRFIADGVLTFAKRVCHPPAQERSFMRSSLEEIADGFYDELRNTLASVLEAA